MIAKLTNLALIGLWPLAWQAPLARAEVAWLFTTDEVTVFSALVDLWETDVYLAALVAFFAIVAPYLKTLGLVYAQFSDSRAAAVITPYLEVVGRFAMADVFLLALFIAVYRGFGDIEVAWGLYFFSGLVLVSMLCGWATWRDKYRTVLRDGSA